MQNKSIATSTAATPLPFLDCAAMLGLYPDMVVYPVSSEDYRPEQEAIAEDFRRYMEACGSITEHECAYACVIHRAEVLSAAPTGHQLSWFKLKNLAELRAAGAKTKLRQVHTLFPASKKSGELYLMDGD